MRVKSGNQTRAVREKLLQEQGGVCALCKQVCSTKQAVLDHRHGKQGDPNFGYIRATLHRTCNALLGKVENNYKRMGFKSLLELMTFAPPVAEYLILHDSNQTGMWHSSFKTEEELKALAKKKRQEKKNGNSK